jgi:hypothetical protein
MSQHDSLEDRLLQAVWNKVKESWDAIREDRAVVLSVTDNKHYLMTSEQWNACLDSVDKEKLTKELTQEIIKIVKEHKEELMDE